MNTPYQLGLSAATITPPRYYHQLPLSDSERREDTRRRRSLREVLQQLDHDDTAPLDDRRREYVAQLDQLEGRAPWPAYSLREIADFADCEWRHHYRYHQRLEMRAADAREELRRLLWAEARSVLLGFSHAHPWVGDPVAELVAMKAEVERCMVRLGLGRYAWAVEDEAAELLRHGTNLRSSDAWGRLLAARTSQVLDGFVIRGSDWVIDDVIDGRFLEHDGWRVILLVTDRFVGPDMEQQIAAHTSRQQHLIELQALTVQCMDLKHPVGGAMVLYTDPGITKEVEAAPSRYKHWLMSMRDIIGRVQLRRPPTTAPLPPDSRCTDCPYKGPCGLDHTPPLELRSECSLV